MIANELYQSTIKSVLFGDNSGELPAIWIDSDGGETVIYTPAYTLCDTCGHNLCHSAISGIDHNYIAYLGDHTTKSVVVKVTQVYEPSDDSMSLMW